jgi:hypothetical protein
LVRKFILWKRGDAHVDIYSLPNAQAEALLVMELEHRRAQGPEDKAEEPAHAPFIKQLRDHLERH